MDDDSSITVSDRSTGFAEVIPICESLEPNLRAKDLPYPRSGHRVVANDRYVVSIGGYNPSLWTENNTVDTYYPILKEIWVFNLVTQRWKKLTTSGSMPKELASHAALLHDHYVLVYGGTGVPFGHSSTNELHVLDMRTGTWRLMPILTVDPTTNIALPKQYGHAFVRHKNNLYVIGGTSGFQYNMQVFGCTLNYQSDIQSNWKLLLRGNQASERYRHEAFYFAGKLHVLGGGTANAVCPLTSVDVFDISKGLWSSKPIQEDPDEGYPSARRCHGLAVDGDQDFVSNERLSVYISGGYDGTDAFDDVWELKLVRVGAAIEYTWRQFQHKLPKPLYFHGMACTPSGSLIIFGGVDGDTQERSATLYRCYLRPPSLLEQSLRQFYIAAGRPDVNEINVAGLKISYGFDQW